MTPSQLPVIEIIGDGKADAGAIDDTPQLPSLGVVTLLTFRLCGSPATMRVRRRKPLFLQKRTPLWRRVQQSKMRAADSGDAGLICVVDSEGEKPQKLRTELEKGRDSKYATFPAAVGVAHPCIEAWLLADGAQSSRPWARRSFRLSQNIPRIFPPLRRKRLAASTSDFWQSAQALSTRGPVGCPEVCHCWRNQGSCEPWFKMSVIRCI